jgi:hypothetical protein
MQKANNLTTPTLRTALKNEAPLGTLPPALPICHISSARYLFAILDEGALRPRHCKVLLKDILYMSYGGLFYRPRRIQTQRAAELPVGLVFSPATLASVSSVFPFDSGAMADNSCLDNWRARMEPFTERFQLPTENALDDTGSLVKVLYKTNKRYLEGNVTPRAAELSDPLPLLASFLRADMTPDVDHRQRSIECLTEGKLLLDNHLLWIGFPARRTAKILRELYERTKPNVPQFRAYAYTRNFSPAEIASRLEMWAYEDVIERFLEIPK